MVCSTIVHCSGESSVFKLVIPFSGTPCCVSFWRTCAVRPEDDHEVVINVGHVSGMYFELNCLSVCFAFVFFIDIFI